MRERDARKLVENFPDWLYEWSRESRKAHKEKFGDDFAIGSLYEWAVHRARGLVSPIQWFVHCLYSKGFKIVRK